MAKIGTIVAVLVVVAVVLWWGRDTDQESTAPPAPTTTQPTSAPTRTVSAVEFCAAYEQLAAINLRVLSGNLSPTELDAAAAQVLELGRATVMSPAARGGLEYVVGSMLEPQAWESPAPTVIQDEAPAFLQYVETTCQPG